MRPLDIKNDATARPRRQIEHIAWFITLYIQVNRSAAVKHFDVCKNFQHSFPSFPWFSPYSFLRNQYSRTACTISCLEDRKDKGTIPCTSRLLLKKEILLDTNSRLGEEKESLKFLIL